MWSCVCCCSSRNKAQARSQKGSSLIKGKVHPVSRIEKWEEKITEAKRNGKIVSFSSYDFPFFLFYILPLQIARHDLILSNMEQLVVNFKASWCLPCKKIAPIYQELASTYTSMIFVTIDVEELAVSNQKTYVP